MYQADECRAVFLSLSAAMLNELKPGGSSVIAERCEYLLAFVRKPRTDTVGATLLRRAVKMFGRAGLLLNVLRVSVLVAGSMQN
jgi:hypothetical protein